MNLTLSDVYNEPAAMASKFSEHLAALFQIFMAPLLLYVIMSESKQMGIFRFYLMATIFWNTIGEILLALLSMALLSPYLCIVSNGFLANFFGIDILYRLYEFLFFATINGLLCVVLCVFYRLFTLLNMTKMIDLFGNWKFFCGLLTNGIFLGLLTIYLLESVKPFVYSQENDIIEELTFLDQELIMNRTICMRL
jgi:hypothetical protein